MPTQTWQVLVVLAAAAAGAWLVGVLVGALVGRFAHRSPVVADLSRRGRTPLRALLVLAAVTLVLDAAPGLGGWHAPFVRALGLALIATVGWLMAVAVFVVADLALARYDVDVVDNRHARRIRTQISLLRRLAVVVIAVLAAAAMLLTFPAARAAGASILASAGVISIVAGLAAQTSLANVFAGLQLAFTDAIRVDDVVVVEDEWGRIEEITLTYVVVHIWDDRRLILPSTYFTTTPFENWTRRQSEVMGTVEFDLDWRAPVEDMRAELRAVLAGTELWDERVGILQITDATSGFVRVRILVSAADSASLFDLRCLIREELVLFLQQDHPTALPHVRLESLPVPAAQNTPGTAGASNGSRRFGKLSAADEPSRRPADPHDSQLFTGSIEAVQRSRAFSGPGAEVFEDRDKTIAAQN